MAEANSSLTYDGEEDDSSADSPPQRDDDPTATEIEEVSPPVLSEEMSSSLTPTDSDMSPRSVLLSDPPATPNSLPTPRLWALPPRPGGRALAGPRGQPERNAAEMEYITEGVNRLPRATMISHRETAELLAMGIHPSIRSLSLHNTEDDDATLSRTSIWRKKISNTLWTFIGSQRTERAMRYAAVVPIAFYFAARGVGLEKAISDISIFSFTIALLFMSPLIAHNSFIWFAALPALLIGFILATIAFVIDSGGRDYYAYLGRAYWHVIVLFIGFLWAGSMRVSPLRRFLGPAHHALSYSIMFCTLRTSTLLRGGTTLKMPNTSDLRIKDILNETRRILPTVIWSVWSAIEPSLQTAVEKGTNTTVWIGSEITKQHSWMAPAVGKPVMHTVSLDNQSVALHMPGGYYIVRMLWSGAGGIGWSKAIFGVCAVIAGCYCLSTLLPPPRTYLARAQAGSVLIAERLKFEADDFSKRLNLINKMSLVRGRSSRRASIQLESEEDLATKYLRERRRSQLRFGRARSINLGGGGRSQLRQRNSITRNALAFIQYDVVMSMHEQLFFFPIGVNTSIAHPYVLKAMQGVAASMFVTMQYWKLIEITFPCQKAGIGFLAQLYVDDSSISDLLATWVQDSGRLLEAISIAVGNPPYLLMDAAGNRRTEACRENIAAAAAAVRDSGKSIKSAEDRLTTEVKSPSVADVSGCRRVATAVWITFYRRGFVKEQLRLADECSTLLSAMEERNWRGLGRSVACFAMPLRVFLSGIGHIFAHTFRALCRKDRAVTHALTPTPFLMMRDIGHGRPYTVQRPTRSRIRRNKVVLLAVTGNTTHLTQTTMQSYEGPPSPSGLRVIEESPVIEIAPNTVLTTVTYAGDEHNIFQYHEVWLVLRFAIAATLLLVGGLWFDDWKERRFLNESYVEKPSTGWEKSIATWGGVVFLACLSLTLQGTLVRAMLALIGVMAGTLLGFMCLLVPPEKGGEWFYPLWISTTGAIWFWFAASRRVSWTSLGPTMGQVAITALVQELVIIGEGYYGSRDRSTICLYWLIANVIGALIAALVSLLVVPTRANRSIRLHVADALFSAAETFAACVEISFCDGTDNLESTRHAAQFREDWEKYHDFQRLNGLYHLRSSETLQNDAFISARLPTPLFKSETNMSVIASGAHRLIDYATLCRTQLNENRKWATRTERQFDLAEVELERRYNEDMTEVAERLVNTHALIQTAINHVGRWRWWWQSDPLKQLTRKDFLTTLEDLCRQSACQLISLGESLSQAAIDGELRQRAFLQSQIDARVARPTTTAERRGDDDSYAPSPLFLSPPAPVIPPHKDRRAVLWAYALLHLAELNTIGAHVAILFPGAASVRQRSESARSVGRTSMRPQRTTTTDLR